MHLGGRWRAAAGIRARGAGGAGATLAVAAAPARPPDRRGPTEGFHLRFMTRK